MVRSRAMLPHNLMVVEGIVPKDGWVGRGERVQSVSLSDYEALHHTGEVQSLAVAWSRDGTVIAGADALIEHAQKKHLHMNDVILLEMNQKALAQIRRSWNDIRIGHEPGATPDQKLQPGPTVVDACELVTKLAMYGYEILGAKIHKLHKLANHLRRERGDDEEALEDADAIESMNGNAATTRQGVCAISTMDPEIRERAIRDMRWERTGGRWETLLALHARTLRRLQRVEGPAGNAASEAVGLNLAAGKRMMREIADPEIEEIIPPEARQATLDWMREIEALEKTEPAPTLAVLHITESAWATATQRKTGTALRRGDLKRALALNEHWTPDNLPETPRQKQILAACEQWKKNRNVDLDEIESLMRSERRKAIMEVGDATMRLCKTLRAAAEDTMNTQGEEGLETALRRHTQANPEIGVLDAQDMGIIAENVAGGRTRRVAQQTRRRADRAHGQRRPHAQRTRERTAQKPRRRGEAQRASPHTVIPVCNADPAVPCRPGAARRATPDGTPGTDPRAEFRIPPRRRRHAGPRRPRSHRSGGARAHPRGPSSRRTRPLSRPHAPPYAAHRRLRSRCATPA